MGEKCSRWRGLSTKQITTQYRWNFSSVLPTVSVEYLGHGAVNGGKCTTPLGGVVFLEVGYMEFLKRGASEQTRAPLFTLAWLQALVLLRFHVRTRQVVLTCNCVFWPLFLCCHFMCCLSCSFMCRQVAVRCHVLFCFTIGASHITVPRRGGQASLYCRKFLFVTSSRRV